MEKIVLDGSHLPLDDIRKFFFDGAAVEVEKDALARVRKSAAFCEKLSRGEAALYGINTGFGEFANRRIGKDRLLLLQKNLLRSHSTGMGPYLPLQVIRLMMLLRLNTLLKGYSGVGPELIGFLLSLINEGVVPAVPMYGSVGASGDLAPLAHAALPVIGEGKVFYKDRLVDSSEALESVGLLPLELKPKEGLALINGTHLMTAYAVWGLFRATSHLRTSLLAAAMSLEAFGASDRIFDSRIHKLKNHPGEIQVAGAFRKVLYGSEVILSHRSCPKVQDPYSFRCIPQVLGAVADTITWVEQWVSREVDAVTDNPLVFWEEGEVLSGGNFHGEHMAIALDALCLAMSELGNIAERRIDKLLDNDNKNLPQCLIRDPGFNSGLMVAQYLAASLASENKVYAHPASVDSIPTSAGFEDHVSMGSVAAFKLEKVLDNVGKIIAVELLCASQALDFLRPRKPGKGSLAAFLYIRERIPFIEQDTVLSGYLEELEGLVESGELVREVEGKIGDIFPRADGPC